MIFIKYFRDFRLKFLVFFKWLISFFGVVVRNNLENLMIYLYWYMYFLV